MIAGQILMADIDARQWINLIELLRPPHREPAPFLVCLLDGERCLKAWHSRRGVLWGFAFPGPDHWEEIRRQYEVDFILALPRGALQEIFHAGQSRVETFDNYVRQLFNLIEGLGAALEQYAFWHPKRPFKLNLPSYEKIEKTFRRLWPDHSTVGLFVFDGEAIFTSVILGKENGEVPLFTTLDAFGSETPPPGERGARRIAELIAGHFAPLHTALFIQLSTLREMRAGAKPLSFLQLSEKRGRATLYPKPFAIRWRLWAGRVLKRL